MLGPSTAEAFTDRPSAFRSLATPPGRYRGSDGSLKPRHLLVWPLLPMMDGEVRRVASSWRSGCETCTVSSSSGLEVPGW